MEINKLDPLSSAQETRRPSGAQSMLRCTDEEGASAGPGSAIKDTDQVIVYMRQDEMKAVIVNASTSFNCRFGSFKMQASFRNKAFMMKQKLMFMLSIYLIELFVTPTGTS